MRAAWIQSDCYSGHVHSRAQEGIQLLHADIQVFSFIRRSSTANAFSNCTCAHRDMEICALLRKTRRKGATVIMNFRIYERMRVRANDAKSTIPICIIIIYDEEKKTNQSTYSR